MRATVGTVFGHHLKGFGWLIVIRNPLSAMRRLFAQWGNSSRRSAKTSGLDALGIEGVLASKEWVIVGSIECCIIHVPVNVVEDQRDFGCGLLSRTRICGIVNLGRDPVLD